VSTQTELTDIWAEALAYIEMWLPPELHRVLAHDAVLHRNGADNSYILHVPKDFPKLDARLTSPISQSLRLAGQQTEINLTYQRTGQAATTPARKNGNALRFFTAWDILTTNWPKPIYAVGDLLPAGLTLLAGRQKIGKSWLALQITRQVALGQELFGRTVKPGNFLYIALEDNQHRLRNRMEKQQWPAVKIDQMLNSGFMLREQFVEQIGYLDAEGADILAAQIDRQRPRLVVIDVLGRAVKGDLNDYETMTAALDPVQTMALQKNCAVLLIDHHNKRSSQFGDGDAILDVMGSGAKTGVPDTIWGLYKKKNSGVAILNCLGRDVEEIELKLQMDTVTGLWQIESEGRAGSHLELTPKRQEIVDILAELGPSTVGEVSSSIGQNRGNTYTRLSDLVEAGIAQRLGQENQPVRYQITPETP